MHDGGTLDLDSLISIARSERSGEIAPATAARLAQFQAAFDAAAEPAGAPAVCFAFHSSVPQAEAAVKYRDVAIDHSKFDYDRIVRHCIAAALAAQPGRVSSSPSTAVLSHIEHPSLTIVRLPLDQANPMYQRVIAMCAFVRSRQFNAPTAFLDSDAFPERADREPVPGPFRHRRDLSPRSRPISTTCLTSNSRSLVRAFFTGYLGTYDRLCGNAAVTGYYGNIKRWRAGSSRSMPSPVRKACRARSTAPRPSAPASATIPARPSISRSRWIAPTRPVSWTPATVLHRRVRNAILDPIIA